MITAGIDLGTQSVKAVILKDGEVISRGKSFSGFDPTKAAEQAVDEALKKAKLSLSDVDHVTATGSGMDMAPHSNSTVSMMGADAKAGVHLFPKARTIIDVGAEEARAVKCDDKGIMMDFVVNGGLCIFQRRSFCRRLFCALPLSQLGLNLWLSGHLSQRLFFRLLLSQVFPCQTP